MIREQSQTVGGDSHSEVRVLAMKPAPSSGIKHSIIRASVGEMRAVLMACLAAGLGLLPAAMSHGIGRIFARVA